MAHSADSSLAQAHGSILPADSGIAVVLARADADDRITIFLTTTSLEACCPACGKPSRQVHSRYHRHLDDLPLAGVAVQLDIRARRFRCANPDCARCTFAEPLPASIGARRARRSSRLAGEQRSIGLVLGGEAGSRLTWCLHMGTSPDTLLRLIRRQPLAVHITSRVLGIDDWAMCKGQRYGTILVDLERGEAIELLEDRTAEVVATWLEQHPGVEIVSRDRANAYADGARQGAPAAIQVADRFHLVKNMVDAVERAVTRLRPRITQAVEAETSAVPERAVTAEMNAGDDPAPSQSPLSSPPKPAPKMTRAEQIQHERRAKRLARYTEVVALRAQGVGIREIAQRLHASPGRIRIWLHAGHFPERAKRKRRLHRLDPFEPYLRQRWQDGCTNATILFRELQQQGYRGSYSAVSQHIAHWRTPEQFWVKGRRRRKLAHRPRVPASTLPAPRRMAFIFIRQPEALDDEDQHMLAAWLTDSDVRSVYDLAQDFTRMIRQRQREHLDTWLANADVCNSVELRNFAMVLRRDYAAVANALDSIWSNGQVEGQVNRLKTVKRQMYGRGKLDLLKQRFLNTA